MGIINRNCASSARVNGLLGELKNMSGREWQMRNGGHWVPSKLVCVKCFNEKL
jgi:hypothetical protein